MIDVEIVEDDAVEIVDERLIAEGEATTDESSDRVLTSEELTIIAEPPLGRMFVEKVFTVVSVAVAATAVLVVIETEVSMFHPITAIALTVELVVKVVVTIIQPLEPSGAVDPKVSTMLEDTLDKQSPFIWASRLAISRMYPLTSDQLLQDVYSFKWMHVRRTAYCKCARAILH